MTVIEKGHITDLALEEYSLNHLAEPELEVVEEHILICPTCQDRLQEVDDFVRAFRMAHANLESGKSDGGGLAPVSLEDFPEESWVPRLAPAPVWFQRPAVWAGLSFLVFLGVAIPVWRSQQAPVSGAPAQVVTLVAQRGATNNAEAGEGRLTLQLDLAGIDNGALDVEVATWDGKPVWRGNIKSPSTKETVSPDTVFAKGQYWVRVRSASDATLLREYGLRVR